EILREDPEAVARLLGLAAVGVEDAEPHVGHTRGRPEKDPVRADPPVAVTNPADRVRAEREVDLPLIHHEVVVAEPVPFRESRHRLLASVVGAGRRARRERCDVPASHRPSAGHSWRAVSAGRWERRSPDATPGTRPAGGSGGYAPAAPGCARSTPRRGTPRRSACRARGRCPSRSTWTRSRSRRSRADPSPR